MSRDLIERDFIEVVDLWSDCGCDGFSIGHEVGCTRRPAGQRRQVKGDIASRVDAVEEITRLRAELSSLRGEGEGSDVIGRLVGALERIRHRADGWVPEEGFEARIAWIEAELDDEPNRMPYGDGITPPCRNGYEVSELLAEHAGLVARQALASIPSTEGSKS